MVRNIAKHVRPLVAALQSSSAAGSFASGQAAAAYAVPAVAPPKTGFFASKRVITPLTEPLPGLSIPKTATPKAPELQLGTIEGAAAAAIEAPGPNVCVAAFVGAGSASEAAPGTSKLLESLAFTATANRTSFRLVRELEKYGAVATAAAGREHIGYAIEATKLSSAEVTEILLDAVLNPKLEYWEVNDYLEGAAHEVQAALTNPVTLATELLHRTAFTGGLSQALLPDPSDVLALNYEVLREFVAANFTPSNLAIAAAGVSLEQLKAVAAPLLAAAGGGAAPAAPKSVYEGGFLAALAPGVAPTVAVAYELKGGLADLKATATAAVLRALLNEAREPLPFLHKSVAAPLTSITPIVQAYKHTGLVGLVATTTPGQAGAALEALAAKLASVAKGVPEAALVAAKQTALAGYQGAIAAKPGVVQDMGLQLLARGKFSASEYAAAVQGLSGGDVAGAVGALLKTAPTVVAAGALKDIPKWDVLAKKFSS